MMDLYHFAAFSYAFVICGTIGTLWIVKRLERKDERKDERKNEQENRSEEDER